MFGFELVKSIDEDDLASAFVSNLLEEAGEGIAQGSAPLAGQEEVGEVVLENDYATGKKVTHQQMQQLNLQGDAFHPEWNYTIRPQTN